MGEKNKKNKLKKLIWKLVLIALGWKMWQERDKIKQIGKNLKEFGREEKREIEELTQHKEGWQKFYRDSGKLFKKYFVPHEGNDHKPHILRAKTLTTIAIALLLVKASVVGYLFLAHPEGARMSEVLIARVIELTNQDRQNNNLNTLKTNPVLTNSAEAKANDLITRNYFSHNTPDGKKPWDFIDRGQYRYLFVGENLAMNFSTADSVHRALMNSPTHKKNILNERYEDIGVAMVSGMINGKQTNVLVELFGTIRSTTLAAVPPTVPPKVEPTPTPESIVEVAGEESNTTVEPVLTPSSESVPTPPEPTPVEPVKPIQDIPETQDFISESLEPVEPELVSDPTERKIVAANPSPNLAIEQNQVTEITAVKGVTERNLVRTNRIVKAAYYTFIAVLLIMVVALIINIVIRVRVQHKHVIIQAMLLILFIGSLIYFQVHTLEGGVENILLL